MNALKVLYNFLSLKLLLVNDRFKLVVLLVDFLQNFFFESFLSQHAILHIRAGFNSLCTLRQNSLIL